MKSVLILFSVFFLNMAESFAFYSEAHVLDHLDEKYIPDHYVTTTETNVSVHGTFYDRIILYKDRRGQVVARKGYVTRGTGEYDQIVFYQNAIGRNLYRVGYMTHKNHGGTAYDRIIFFQNHIQNHIGRNQAILSTSGKHTFYQNGVFKNIAGLNQDNFLDGSLRPISREQFKELFYEFLDLVLQ